MHRLVTAYLCFAVSVLASIDYRDITTFTGPCARELALMVKEGDTKSARDLARALCRNDAATACTDLWLVYAYCSVKLMEPDAIDVSKELVRRFPNSAAANWIYSAAIAKDSVSGGILRYFRQMGILRKALERTVQLDPNCHPARNILVNLYGLPRLLGGDSDKLKQHLAELDQRDPYYSALTHGELEVENKNHSAAASFFREARRLQPEKSEPVRKLIKLDAALGNFEEAFAACLSLKPEYPGDSTRDFLLVDLSAQSGLYSEEALAAGTRYLANDKRGVPLERAGVMVNTAVILKQLGRMEESARMVADAETEWEGAKELFIESDKFARKRQPAMAARR